MLASELARELNVTPSVMSRRLQHYYRTTGFNGSTQPLESKVIEDMRQVHLLMAEHPGTSMAKALDIHLGKGIVPVPPAVAQDILQRITAVEASQKRIEEKIDRLLKYFRKAYGDGDLPQVEVESGATFGE